MERKHINLSIEKKPLATPIPNMFIDQYLSVSHPSFVLVYIFFYRHCTSSSEMITFEFAAKSLNILESDIVNALKYWEKEGLVELSESTDNFGVQFLEIKDKCSGELKKEISSDTIKPVIMESRPQYTLQELEIYKSESTQIQRLFSLGEQTLGRLLNYNDLSTLFSLYDWLRLPTEVIEYLLKYCEENNHRNMRYIEKVAVDWAENEINTIDRAKEYIRIFNTEYREILKALGQSSRNPTKSEVKYMEKWLTEFKIPLQIILEACDKTIMQLGHPKFSYIDQILTKWNEAGINSIEKIKQAEHQFYESKEAKKTSQKSHKPKTNRFINFKQREWNFEQIEQLERQYLENEIKIH